MYPLLPRNDTVPISVWRAGGMWSTECPLVTARSELRKVLFFAPSVCFLFVYEISWEPLNGRRVWSIARTSLKVKVTRDKKRQFSAFSVAACSLFGKTSSATIFGSRPSDHYFRSVCLFVCLSVCLSVCLFVCLCRVFLSRLQSDLDQTRTHVTCPGLVVSPRI